LAVVLQALRRKGEAVKFEIPDEHVNSLQVRSIYELLKAAKGMHYADVGMRINGQDVGFQADWLRHMTIIEDTKQREPPWRESEIKDASPTGGE
jgi:hypothetical protein